MENKEKLRRTPLKSIMICLCALMFVSSFALFAVSLALSLVDITAGGHISFTAFGVYAKVTGTVTGTKTTNTLDTLNFDASTTNFTTPTSWSNMTLDFTNDNLITLVVNFQNLSTENSFTVSFEQNFPDSNLNVVATDSDYIEGEESWSFNAINVPANSTKSINIELSVVDVTKAVNTDFSLKMTLADDNVLNYDYTILSESTIALTGLKGGKVTGGTYTFPSKLTIDGKDYTVTEIHTKDSSMLTNSWTSLKPNLLVIPSNITCIKSVYNGYEGSCKSIFDYISFTSLTFEEPANWNVYAYDDMTSEFDLDNPTSISEEDLATNALDLAKTTYAGYMWKKS